MSSQKVLGDRYVVGELLGYGGMAEVHKARDTRLDRDVAVKILRSDLARDQTFQARFRREAQSAASLNHSAIVAVYDTGADDTTNPPTPYIIMEYVEGQTLRDLLRSKTTLEPLQAMRLTAEICGALDFSHRNGIIHRDVKPGNVMITPAGRVKVMDFGIARAVSDTAATMTATAAVIGTAQYLSPEQARGESVDARSDVYAVGCVLFELLTGAPPFVGDSPVAVAYQHVRENPRRPSSVLDGISRELDAITMKALSKNPANRYQSAAAMAEDLDRAITGRKIAATPVLTEEETTELISTTPPVPFGMSNDDADDEDREQQSGVRGRTWAILGLLLVAAIVAAFFIIRQLGDDEPPPPVQIAVPSVAGMTQEEATAALEAEGLALGEVAPVVSSIDEVGKVIGQDPASGSQVEEGTVVNLEVGNGPALQSVPPDIIGKPEQAVTAQLAELDLKASPTPRDGPEPAGTVVDSNPKPGESAPEGSTVTIWVSTGQVEIPNVTGQLVDAGTQALAGAGFANVAVVEQNTDDPAFPAGTIISQDPAAGKVDVTAAVTLTVSSGPQLGELPQLVGLPLQQAQQQLAAAGFTSAQITEQENQQPAGTVIAQNPAPGQHPLNTPISIVVSSGPPATSSSAAPPSSSGSTPPEDD